MAKSEHLSVLRKGAATWNVWRQANPDVKPDLSNAQLGGLDLYDADLSEADLRGAKIIDAFAPLIRLCNADLRKADLSHTNLRYANLNRANLSHANLTKAELWFAILHGADLSYATMQGTDLSNAQMFQAKLKNADLRGASLRSAWLDEADFRGARLHGAVFNSASLARANLSGTDLSGVDLSADLIGTNLFNSNLTGAKLCGMLLGTDLRKANLTDCRVYGVSVWDVRLDDARQQGLVITRDDEPLITVDDLEVAQFVHLIINNAKIKSILDTLTSKTVLILGRFTSERKSILDQLKLYIHKDYGYVPILFDFEKPSLTTVETVTLLARMAKVVIADLSEAKSVLQELQAIVPISPSITILPIIASGQRLPPMIDFFKPYPWFHNVIRYRTIGDLTHVLNRVIPRVTTANSLSTASNAKLANRAVSGPKSTSTRSPRMRGGI